MSLNRFELKQGAIIVSDAHYSERYNEFYDFLLSLKSKQIPCTQLVLLGDMFDLLIPQFPSSVKNNQKVIDLINSIANDLELVYFEGNHDFNLCTLFPDVFVIPIAQQPYTLKYGDKKLMFLHGDINVGLSYTIYCAIIRQPMVIYFLQALNFISGNKIAKALSAKLDTKENCNEFTTYRAYIEKKYSDDKYREYDYIIEGHYHQNKRFKYDNFEYINLDGFACYQRYISVQSSQEDEIFSDRIFQKET